MPTINNVSRRLVKFPPFGCRRSGVYPLLYRLKRARLLGCLSSRSAAVFIPVIRARPRPPSRPPPRRGPCAARTSELHGTAIHRQSHLPASQIADRRRLLAVTLTPVRVLPLAVPPAPISDRFPVTLTTPRAAAEISTPVRHEVAQGKPARTVRASLLADLPLCLPVQPGAHGFPALRRLSFACELVPRESGARVAAGVIKKPHPRPVRDARGRA